MCALQTQAKDGVVRRAQSEHATMVRVQLPKGYVQCVLCMLFVLCAVRAVR